MKRHAVGLVVAMTLGWSGLASAQGVPGSVAFTARLNDNGMPVTGMRDFSLAVFDAETGGASTWTEAHNSVMVVVGLAYLQMGSVTTLDATTFNGTPRWLEITVNGTIMTPRLPLLSVPYAIRAGVASNADAVGGFTAAQLQRRVGPCQVGQAITSIAVDGTPTCSQLDAVPPVPPGGTQADARASCQAIRTAGATADGVYWIDPNGGMTADAYQVHCEMTTLTGGWTLVMNIDPADGDFVPFTNVSFWLGDAEYGQIENRFTNDYKSPAAWTLPGTSVLVVVTNPGAAGKVIGWKAWSMPLKTFDTFFDGAAANSTQTTGVLGADVTNVYAFEPIIKNGAQLQSNRLMNPNNDRVRLGVNGYPAQGDDNQPGLGTQMNEASCGVGVLCYRYRDVELWVNSTANLWCSQNVPNIYKWVGTDGGCGANCAATGPCDDIAGPGYSPYWTYRIYVR